MVTRNVVFGNLVWVLLCMLVVKVSVNRKGVMTLAVSVKSAIVFRRCFRLLVLICCATSVRVVGLLRFYSVSSGTVVRKLGLAAVSFTAVKLKVLSVSLVSSVWFLLTCGIRRCISMFRIRVPVTLITVSMALILCLL